MIPPNVLQRNAEEAYERIVAMAAEGIEAMAENRSLHGQIAQAQARISELELENQRLRFELRHERNLKVSSYHSGQELWERHSRLIDLLAGRVERSGIDAEALVRGFSDALRQAGREPMWDPDDDGPGEETPHEQVS